MQISSELILMAWHMPQLNHLFYCWCHLDCFQLLFLFFSATNGPSINIPLTCFWCRCVSVSLRCVSCTPIITAWSWSLLDIYSVVVCTYRFVLWSLAHITLNKYLLGEKRHLLTAGNSCVQESQAQNAQCKPFYFFFILLEVLKYIYLLNLFFNTLPVNSGSVSSSASFSELFLHCLPDKAPTCLLKVSLKSEQQGSPRTTGSPPLIPGC